MRRRLYLIVCIIIAACVCSVGSADHVENGDVYCPERIVVFPLHAEEILLSLITPERIAYTGHQYFDDQGIYSPTMYLTKELPGDMWQNTDADKLLSLQPDLVIMSSELESEYGEALFPELTESGIPVLFISWPESINDIEKNIDIIGRAVGETEKASDLILEMNNELAQLPAPDTDSRSRSSVKMLYYNEWQDSFWIVSEQLGVQNLYASSDYVNLDDDQIAAWDPDIIFYYPALRDTDGTILGFGDSCSYDNYQNIVHNPKLADTSAVKHDYVFPLCIHSSHFIVDNIRFVSTIIEQCYQQEESLANEE